MPTMVRMPRAVRKGWPVTLEMSDTLPGPREVVWELLTDWEHQDEWMLEASDFVVTTAHRAGLGVEAEATIKIAGITTRDRVRIVGWEPPRRLALDHSGWVKGTGEIHLTPLSERRTHIFWKEELRPPMGLVGALGMTGLKPLMRRTFNRDLRILGALVRARAETGSP